MTSFAQFSRMSLLIVTTSNTAMIVATHLGNTRQNHSARTSTLHQHSLGLTKTRHQSGKSLRNPIAKMFLPRSSVPRSNRVKPSEVRSTPSTLISDKPAVCFGTLAFFALLAAFERTTTMKSCLCTLVRSRGY